MAGAAAIPRSVAAGREATQAGERPGAESGAGTIRFEGLGKTYHSSAGKVQALEGIDLRIGAGEIFGIIGRSGAGKSSLLRTINRLEEPTDGRVLVDGEPIAALDEAGLVALRRRIGMIFQHFNLLSAKTVFENVALPLRVAGVPRPEIAARVAETLGLVGLEGKEQTYPSRLSGGQKQRVGIARALVSRPEILLCDEATSALDPETTLSILTLLREINRRLGITIVLITHEMSVIRESCHRVVVLEQGRAVEQGPVWQVFGAPRHPATLALLQPLTRGLPEDLAGRIRDRPAGPGDAAIVELGYGGAAPPELAPLAGARLIHAAVERIQGHSVGRMLVALDQGAALPEGGKVVGYVAADD